MPSFVVVLQASGSTGDPQIALDEKRRKRMLSNRESAKRSRMRKQHQSDDLVNQAGQLKSQNAQIEMQINVLALQYMAVESSNAILRAQMNELAERMQSLNSMLTIMKGMRVG